MSNTFDFVLKNIVKTYRKKRVLDLSEMTFKSGQFVALMGKNGSGKSTLMRLLAQHEPFDSGEILFGLKSLASTSVELNPQLVFISEDQVLPYPVGLSYWVTIHKKLYPQFDDAIFQRLTRQFEIDTKQSFHSMSRGQKMKALFCLQAPKRPNIYLLDEITAVLDASSRWTLIQFLSEEALRGCVVIMSTNIASEMQGFATDVVFLEKGKLIFSSNSKSLHAHFQKVRVTKDKILLLTPDLAAKFIGANSDNTWTYMFLKANGNAPAGVENDARGITISEVQSYFTAIEDAV